MPSSSMEPTIPANSKVTIDYSTYKTEPPARFDIVAFHPPVYTNAIFLFRVIGLPGETVQIKTNGILIDEKEIIPPNGLKYIPRIPGTNDITLNSTEYFLLGDNTKNARDCRYFGPINKTTIIGKVIKIEPMNAR